MNRGVWYHGRCGVIVPVCVHHLAWAIFADLAGQFRSFAGVDQFALSAIVKIIVTTNNNQLQLISINLNQ